MRIESIDIRGFGCLVNRRYEFPTDRVALIVADNETGKSTLAAAVLAALCGFPKRKQSGETMKLSEVYKPWDGDVYAVEIDLAAGGKRLRVERDFTRDSFVVRDRDTGKDVSAEYDTDLTSQLLYLPREDFQRIAFVRGKDAPSLGPMPSVQARLSALADGSTADTGAEVAIAALGDARYSLDTSLTIPNAIKRLATAADERRRALDALDASLEQAGEEASRLEQSKALHAELTGSLKNLDAEHQAARQNEEQARARQVEELQAKLAVKDAEARLAAISRQRQAGKRAGSSIAFAGIAMGLVSLGLWILGLVQTGMAVGGTLVGIAIAAAGAVWATRADTSDTDEKVRLEREVEDAQRAQPQEPANSGRSSADIEQEQRELRHEIDSLNLNINDLEKRVGSTIDGYRRDYARLKDNLHGLEHELAKAQRFGKAVEIAREVLGEVAEDSRRRWAAALNERASAILPHLNPDYDDLRFDESLGFTLKHVPDNRTLENPEVDARLSTGAKDQIYLAVRLAVCGELSKTSEAVPVLLDDPLLAADDHRFAGGLRYIAETFASDHQVLILSCSEQRHLGLADQTWFAERVQRLELETAPVEAADKGPR